MFHTRKSLPFILQQTCLVFLIMSLCQHRLTILSILFVYPYTASTYCTIFISSLISFFVNILYSTWEHLKLLFFPMLFLTILEYFLHTKPLPDNFLQSRTLGILAGMGFIVSGFYTIQGVLGKNYGFLNILLYYIAVIFSLYVENRIQQNKNFSFPKSFAIILLSLITICFFLFTYFPPNIGIFISPV